MKNKVIARVFGGLGNQMFIYAYARALSLRTNSKLLLDTKTGFYRDIYQRSYSLNHFNISSYTEANRLQSFDFKGGRYIRYLFRNYFTNLISSITYLEEVDNKNFQPKYVQLTVFGTLWIEGYWQTPLYFKDIRTQLEKELKIITPLSKETKKVGLQMNNCNAVCLHARRLRNNIVGEDKASIKSLSLNYYYQSIKYISSKIENPVFFCFSDDILWLKENLKIDFPTVYVTHNSAQDKDYEDFWLMQQCKHFIISNSTFSWWPAWLSNNTNKIIIAPSKHFWDCKDILPLDWHTISE